MNHPQVSLRPLERRFYSRYTLEVARDLLGMILVREVPEGVMAGRIVEVEAYRGSDDPASHAYRGMTRRNKVMWGKPGTAYVYRIYGIHFCLNVVTEPEGVPAAVLIRAVEPLLGTELMLRNRRVRRLRDLTSGPAKLTKAMLIDERLNGWDMTIGKVLYIARGEPVSDEEVATSPRIGVEDRRPWRFYVKVSPFVSRH